MLSETETVEAGIEIGPTPVIEKTEEPKEVHVLRHPTWDDIAGEYGGF